MPDERAAMEVLGESGWKLLVDVALAHDASEGDALAAAAALAKRRPDAPAARRTSAKIRPQGMSETVAV